MKQIFNFSGMQILIFIPSVLWRCWLGGRKGIRPVKNWVVGAGVVICLELGADLHMAQLMPLPLTVSCFSKIQIGFYLYGTGFPGSPGKRAVKRVCVCRFWFWGRSCRLTDRRSWRQAGRQMSRDTRYWKSTATASWSSSDKASHRQPTTIRYDTIRDAILTCARKPTWVSLIYRTETTTKKCKTEKRKSKKTDMLRSNSTQSGESM